MLTFTLTDVEQYICTCFYLIYYFSVNWHDIESMTIGSVYALIIRS